MLGDPTNCRNLLDDDQVIVVFPEGAKGSGKVWKERYTLKPFGRGFMRLALRTGSPIVPCAVIGGEESIVSLYDWKGAARMFGGESSQGRIDLEQVVAAGVDRKFDVEQFMPLPATSSVRNPPRLPVKTITLFP